MFGITVFGITVFGITVFGITVCGSTVCDFVPVTMAAGCRPVVHQPDRQADKRQNGRTTDRTCCYERAVLAGFPHPLWKAENEKKRGQWQQHRKGEQLVQEIGGIGE